VRWEGLLEQSEGEIMRLNRFKTERRTLGVWKDKSLTQTDMSLPFSTFSKYTPANPEVAAAANTADTPSTAFLLPPSPAPPPALLASCTAETPATCNGFSIRVRQLS